ncbi:MAG: DUF2063 domain-containing protein [Methylococcaceae bacterium]|nr:DUF2063 domain-containing protein [Methylococcaceae bacterium]
MMTFQIVQQQFLAHLRNPKQVAAPIGFNASRVGVYVDFLYNKFNDSLSACFPVTQQLLGELAWQ